MKTICLILLIFATILCPSVPSVQADDAIVTMVADPWSPYYDKNLPGYGFAAEIISAAYATKSYRVTFSFLPWVRAMKSVEKGKYDAIATAWFNEERDKKYLFSKPYTESHILFFHKKENPLAWNRLEDLKNKTIGVVRGYSYSPEFNAADYIKKNAANNTSQNIKKLLKNRLDVVIMDKFVGLYYFNNEYKEYADKVIYNTRPVSVNKLHCLFSRNIPGIRKKIEAFNSGLEEIIKDGTYDAILAKHHLR